MRSKIDLRLPKEHGAWAMLYVPLVIGAVVGGRLNGAVILLSLSLTFFFIARPSVMYWWRAKRLGRSPRYSGRFALAYLASAGLGGLVLLFVYKLFWLIPLAVLGAALLLINAEQGVRLKDRSIGGELMAIAGLTLSAPAAYYAARSEITGTAAWLWLMCALYFASSVFYVRLRVYGASPRKAAHRREIGLICTVYHCSLAVLLLLLLLFKADLSWLMAVAFGPILVRTFWHLAKPSATLSLKRIGVLEIIYSLVFTLFLSLSFR